MEAKKSNEGKIFPYHEIKFHNNSVFNTSFYSDPHICVYLHGNWKWQNLHSISRKTFSKYQPNIVKYISKIKENEYNADESCLNIIIKGAKGDGKNIIICAVFLDQII